MRERENKKNVRRQSYPYRHGNEHMHRAAFIIQHVYKAIDTADMTVSTRDVISSCGHCGPRTVLWNLSPVVYCSVSLVRSRVFRGGGSTCDRGYCWEEDRGRGHEGK
jgi:hypothetical protein